MSSDSAKKSFERNEFELLVESPFDQWEEEKKTAVKALLHRVKTGQYPDGFKESRPSADAKKKDSELTETVKEAQVILEKNEPIQLDSTLTQQMNDCPEIFAVRYLMGRKWHVPDAAKMVITAAQFRIKEDMANQLLFPTFVPIQGWSEEELIAARGQTGSRPLNTEQERRAAGSKGFYAGTWYKTDKFGCPVFIERTGDAKQKEMYELNKKLTPPGGDLAAGGRADHYYKAEVGATVVRAENIRRKEKGLPPVHQVTVIQDCSGLSLGKMYSPALNLLGEVTKYDRERTPEGMARLFLCNAPAMITVVWAVVKHWLDEKTKKKIFILKPHETKEKLLEIIDAENLPEFLGGTCTLPVPEVLSSEEALEAEAAVGDFAETKVINVKAGKAEKSEYIIKNSGDTVIWDYLCDGKGKDIIFKAQFLPLSEDGKTPAGGLQTVGKDGELIQGSRSSSSASTEGDKKKEGDEKTTQGSGSFTCPESVKSGKLIFSFDNSYSWMTAKAVSFRVTRANDLENALGGAAGIKSDEQ